MSRLYDTVEPAVIDDDMLTQAVHAQGPKDEAGRIAREEGIDFGEVASLRLDFKNILKIDNLWCFTSLTRLQLDNNIIERIECLDHMVNLRWLDLSFNNIEAIEGLSTLTKLEDLTLYNNRISRIENIDSLVNLQILSLGNNKLKDLENLLYMRRFKELRTMNLKGNPFCEREDYLPYTYAYLPQLVYLDYKLIDNAARSMAQEQYQIRIEELQADERAAERKQEEAAEKAKEFALHKKAYVENLNGPMLFDSMYKEDTEGLKLKGMPGVDEMLDQFKERFVQVCQQMFDFGLEEHKRREEDVSQFWECINIAKNENKNDGVTCINEFLEYKKRISNDLAQMNDQNAIEKVCSEYKEKVYVLWERLMALEIQLVDQFEEAVKDFDRNLAELVSSFIENMQGLMAQCRDLENQHNERMMELAIVVLEKVLKNELEEEIHEDLRMLLVDKDTVINAVQASHDLHLLKIDNREDDITTRINAWMKNLLENIHQDEEVTRNRSRITEVNNLVDHLRDEIDNIELPGMGY